MSKIKITETNGASAEDISAAIGEFLAQQENEASKEAESEEDK